MPNPPITVGELTDVPAPESPINAQYMQEVANRIAHRFASVAAMNGWAAANGSLAYVSPWLYLRQDGAWQQLAWNHQIASLDAAYKAADTNLQSQITAAVAATPRWSRGTTLVPAGHTPGASFGIQTGVPSNAMVGILSVEAWWWPNDQSPTASNVLRPLPFEAVVRAGGTGNPIFINVWPDPNVYIMWALLYDDT